MRDTREVKASGLQGEAVPGMIEIIDDDADPFGDRGTNITTEDTGGRRWVGPVAALALITVVGYSVVTSATETGIPDAAPVTSPAFVPLTTQPAPTPTTVAPPIVPYYAADPPREFAVQSADFFNLKRNPTRRTGNYQLWATPEASGTTGSWFSIQSAQVGGDSLLAIDAYRVQTGDQPMAISRTSTGQSVVQFFVNRSVSITLTAYGWSDPDLVRLAQSVVADDGDVSLADPTLTDGYDLISSVQPWVAVQGSPAEQILYASSTSPDSGVGVSVAPRPPTNEGGATLDRQIALRFLLDNQTPFDVDGHLAVAGVTTDQVALSIASWIAGNHIVTVSASMPVPDLISIAQTVHEVSSEDWNGMQFQAARYNSDHNFGKYQETAPLPVSSGTDAAGQSWATQVSVATFPKHRELTWHWDDAGAVGSGIDGTPKINTMVDNRRTYVMANLPRAIASTANLQITLDGLDPVTVPFSNADPNLDHTFAAYAFSEATSYSAQIVGEDGVVLATWPSS
jgi:hypothetical protein